MLRGLMRGAISQIVGVAGIFTGFLVASHHDLSVGSFLTKQFPSISVTATGPISFILLFLLTWFSIAVAGSWIVRVLHSAGLGFFDRLWGAMIGFGKALLFAIVTISFLTLFSFHGNSPIIAQSVLAPRVMEVSEFSLQISALKGSRRSCQKTEGGP